MSIFTLLLISYLIGSFPTAIVIGELFYNKDIRSFGSGNSGATNAFRVFGFIPAIVVLLFDILKGFTVASLSSDISIQFFLVLSVIIGHVYPIFARFRGGKAVATTIGCFLAINPLLLIFPIITYLSVLFKWRISSLASICSVLSISLSAIIINTSLITGILIILCILIILFTHRENIERIFTGKENKLF